MQSIQLKLSDETASRLSDRAKERGLSAEALILMVLEEVLSQQNEELSYAVDHVLAKNSELYFRMAGENLEKRAKRGDRALFESALEKIPTRKPIEGDAKEDITKSYLNRIKFEAGKRGGQPTIRGLRITVDDVLSYLASGMSTVEILSDFPSLTKEDILAVLEYKKERERVAPSPRSRSPLDVKGVKTKGTLSDIKSALKESRYR